jgi:hypothetical protein
MQHLLGAFPHSGLLRGSATLDQMKTDRRNLAGRLSGRDRAALPDPELLPRRVRRVGPRQPRLSNRPGGMRRVTAGAPVV